MDRYAGGSRHAYGHGGLKLAYRRLAGDLGPTIWVHATGFCKEVWDPVLDDMREEGGIPDSLLVDQRCHGASDQVGGDIDWWDLGRDLLAAFDDLEFAPRFGVGHSSGGAVLTLAELLRHGTFDRLVLIEPIIFPTGVIKGAGVIETALKRRSVFDSRKHAHDLYATKSPFAAWDSRALEAYLRGGLTTHGDNVRLACDPLCEAAFYRGGDYHEAWSHLDELEIPVLLVVGEKSTAYQGEYSEVIAGRFPNAELVTVHGAGHLLPMERPSIVASLIFKWLSQAG